LLFPRNDSAYIHGPVIDTDQQLAAFLPQLRAAGWIALDTEADSLHAFPEKLCLIQISITGADRLFDPLSGLDLAPALEELRRHELILHGADYDLRLLRRHCGFVPTAIFDTMIASRLLGDRQFGLHSLVSRHLGVTLEKGPQKANWAQRPLTPRMEAYARNDTRYLKPLADILKAELHRKGRLAWQTETCARLITDCSELRPVDADRQWRVKGSNRLSPSALGVLREIWHWREREALAANRPPYFILQPATMVSLAAAAVNSHPVDLPLPRHLSPRRREGILKAIEKGLAAEKPAPSPRPRGRRQTDAERKRLHDLERRRNHRAAELDIDPTLVATRATLVALSQDWEKYRSALMNWQQDLLTK